MKQQILLVLPFLGAALARPASIHKKREVPGEHAHENILRQVDELLALNNPDNIQASVFGLLGAAAAIEGAGDIADADCLQQATADQAFSNAKEAGDVDGMTAALIYRALERNTGSVGLASVPCESIQAVNVEIAALQQHQDPAGEGAQELNKQIAAELAVQIDSIGGDATLANEASTFEPGELGDPTGAGNTCDDADDAAGCINSLGLRVDDLSEAEIQAAVEAGSQGIDGAVAGDAAAAAGDVAAAGNGTAVADVSGAAGNATAASGAEEAASADQAEDASEDAQSEDSSEQASASAGGAAQFGGCDPTIVFGLPSDGRQEDAFEANDLATFAHGSALNIGVISGFICSQLPNKCDVSDAGVSACDAAASAADGLSGQDAADAFNQALGL